MNKDEMKVAVKEAFKEWLDHKYAEFGRWSFKALMAAVFGALAYFWLTMSGWHK